MDTKSLLTVCNMVILGSVIINIADYNLTRGKGFFMFPRSIPARRFFMGWSLLLALLAFFNVLHLLPVVVSMVFLGAYVLFSQGYAVYCRHRKTQGPS
jgi:hypothetical protein